MDDHGIILWFNMKLRVFPSAAIQLLGGSDQRSEIGVFIFPLCIPHSMGEPFGATKSFPTI